MRKHLLGQHDNIIENNTTLLKAQGEEGNE